MKIKDGFVMRQVMGKTVVVAVGDTSKTFHGMIKMNKVATDIWNGVQEGLSEEQIAETLVEKYSEVSLEKALEDTKRVISTMINAGIME